MIPSLEKRKNQSFDARNIGKAIERRKNLQLQSFAMDGGHWQCTNLVH
jgi:hypothetical protein